MVSSSAWRRRCACQKRTAVLQPALWRRACRRGPPYESHAGSQFACRPCGGALIDATPWVQAKGLAGVFAAFGLTSASHDGAQCGVQLCRGFSGAGDSVVAEDSAGFGFRPPPPAQSSTVMASA